MNRSTLPNRQAAVLLAALSVVTTVAACTEKLESGAACPVLCPQQAINLRDTIIGAVVVDTSVAGIPSIGTESFLLLSNHGDTLDTRVLVRFDTLPKAYRRTGAAVDSVIRRVDSAYVVARLVVPKTKPLTPVTIELYDVDTTASDTVAASLLPLFRPDRFLGSKTFKPESLTDTLKIPIAGDTVLDRLTRGARLRVGFRLATPGTQLSIRSTEGGAPVVLTFRATPDTTTPRITVSLVSHTPTDQPFLESALRDFMIVASSTGPPPATAIALGGVPSHRSYLRFDIPLSILDSTTVVRAALLLTQRPNRSSPNPSDTVTIYSQAILASNAVTDIRTALQFVAGVGAFGLDSVRTVPGDSGVKRLEMVNLLRSWRTPPTTPATTIPPSPRAIALRSSAEGQSPAEVDFFALTADASVRPRLQITYVPRVNFGLP